MEIRDTADLEVCATKDRLGGSLALPRVANHLGLEECELLLTIRLPGSERWDEIPTRKLMGFLAGVSVFLILVLKSTPGFVFALDDANLMFHEAGHPLYGIFSNRLMVYGGTMGQLTFPVILAVSFWRKRDAIAFAVSVIWFFENWLNIARYMADAREQALPLLGGGEHDWWTIFGRWGVLQYDTKIAAAVRTVGWIGMAVACVWVIVLWWVGRRNPATPDPTSLAVTESVSPERPRM